MWHTEGGQDEHLFLYLPQVKQLWFQWKQIWKAIYNQAAQADTSTSVVGRFGVIYTVIATTFIKLAVGQSVDFLFFLILKPQVFHLWQI